jgi:hypothetical protein
MSEKVFKSIAGSLREAGEILRGETKDYRQFIKSRSSAGGPVSALAICAASDEDELIPGKLYTVNILPSGRITVRDESGETVICGPNDFILVEFQPDLERRIRKLVNPVTA